MTTTHDLLLCAFCHGLLYEPVVMPCSKKHTMCARCLVVACQTSITNKVNNQGTYMCPFATLTTNGCAFNASVSPNDWFYLTHPGLHEVSRRPELHMVPTELAYQMLMKTTVHCPSHYHDGCPWVGELENASVHLQTECLERRMRCEWCRDDIPAKALKDHQTTCGQRQETCPYCHLGWYNHKESEMLSKHWTSECIKFPSHPCPNAPVCKTIGTREVIAKHAETCIHTRMGCPVAACAQSFATKKELLHHLVTTNDEPMAQLEDVVRNPEKYSKGGSSVSTNDQKSSAASSPPFLGCAYTTNATKRTLTTDQWEACQKMKRSLERAMAWMVTMKNRAHTLALAPTCKSGLFGDTVLVPVHQKQFSDFAQNALSDSSKVYTDRSQWVDMLNVDAKRMTDAEIDTLWTDFRALGMTAYNPMTLIRASSFYNRICMIPTSWDHPFRFYLTLILHVVLYRYIVIPSGMTVKLNWSAMRTIFDPETGHESEPLLCTRSDIELFVTRLMTALSNVYLTSTSVAEFRSAWTTFFQRLLWNYDTRDSTQIGLSLTRAFESLHCLLPNAKSDAHIERMFVLTYINPILTDDAKVDAVIRRMTTHPLCAVWERVIWESDNDLHLQLPKTWVWSPTCLRCNGTGRGLTTSSLGHESKGICWKCNGHKKVVQKIEYEGVKWRDYWSD